MTTTTITSKALPAVVVLVSVLASLLMALGVGLLHPATADARPMLNPCQYDNTCVSTTVRR